MSLNRRIWSGPIVMGLLTASGLTTALVSDTWGDWWAWVGLGVPTLVMGWYAWTPVRTSAARPDRNAEPDIQPSQTP